MEFNSSDNSDDVFSESGASGEDNYDTGSDQDKSSNDTMRQNLNSWEYAWDDLGNMYYFNPKTGESRWDLPPNANIIENNDSSSRVSGYDNPDQNLFRNSITSTGTWKQYVAPGTNDTYYYNTRTGESQWQSPTRNSPAKSPVVSSNRLPAPPSRLSKGSPYASRENSTYSDFGGTEFQRAAAELVSTDQEESIRKFEKLKDKSKVVRKLIDENEDVWLEWNDCAGAECGPVFYSREGQVGGCFDPPRVVIRSTTFNLHENSQILKEIGGKSISDRSPQRVTFGKKLLSRWNTSDATKVGGNTIVRSPVKSPLKSILKDSSYNDTTEKTKSKALIKSEYRKLLDKDDYVDAQMELQNLSKRVESTRHRWSDFLEVEHKNRVEAKLVDKNMSDKAYFDEFDEDEENEEVMDGDNENIDNKDELRIGKNSTAIIDKNVDFNLMFSRAVAVRQKWPWTCYLDLKQDTLFYRHDIEDFFQLEKPEGFDDNENQASAIIEENNDQADVESHRLVEDFKKEMYQRRMNAVQSTQVQRGQSTSAQERGLRDHMNLDIDTLWKRDFSKETSSRDAPGSYSFEEKSNFPTSFPKSTQSSRVTADSIADKIRKAASVANLPSFSLNASSSSAAQSVVVEPSCVLSTSVLEGSSVPQISSESAHNESSRGSSSTSSNRDVNHNHASKTTSFYQDMDSKCPSSRISLFCRKNSYGSFKEKMKMYDAPKVTSKAGNELFSRMEERKICPSLLDHHLQDGKALFQRICDVTVVEEDQEGIQVVDFSVLPLLRQDKASQQDNSKVSAPNNSSEKISRAHKKIQMLKELEKLQVTLQIEKNELGLQSRQCRSLILESLDLMEENTVTWLEKEIHRRHFLEELVIQRDHLSMPLSLRDAKAFPLNPLTTICPSCLSTRDLDVLEKASKSKDSNSADYYDVEICGDWSIYTPHWKLFSRTKLYRHRLTNLVQSGRPFHMRMNQMQDKLYRDSWHFYEPYLSIFCKSLYCKNVDMLCDEFGGVVFYCRLRKEYSSHGHFYSSLYPQQPLSSQLTPNGFIHMSSFHGYLDGNSLYWKSFKDNLWKEFFDLAHEHQKAGMDTFNHSESRSHGNKTNGPSSNSFLPTKQLNQSHRSSLNRSHLGLITPKHHSEEFLEFAKTLEQLHSAMNYVVRADSELQRSEQPKNIVSRDLPNYQDEGSVSMALSRNPSIVNMAAEETGLVVPSGPSTTLLFPNDFEFQFQPPLLPPNHSNQDNRVMEDSMGLTPRIAGNAPLDDLELSKNAGASASPSSGRRKIDRPRSAHVKKSTKKKHGDKNNSNLTFLWGHKTSSIHPLVLEKFLHPKDRIPFQDLVLMIGQHGSNPVPILKLMMFLLERNLGLEAFYVYQRALPFFPRRFHKLQDNVLAHLLAIQLARKYHSEFQGFSGIQVLLDTCPLSSIVLAEVARICHEYRYCILAEHLFIGALMLDPLECHALRGYGHILIEKENWSMANRYWSRVSESSLLYGTVRLEMAWLQELQPSDAEAQLLAYKLVLSLGNKCSNRTLSRALHSLGHYHHRRGEYDKALDFYQRAIQIDPHNSACFLSMGSLQAIMVSATSFISEIDLDSDSTFIRADSAYRRGILCSSHILNDNDLWMSYLGYGELLISQWNDFHLGEYYLQEASKLSFSSCIWPTIALGHFYQYGRDNPHHALGIFTLCHRERIDMLDGESSSGKNRSSHNLISKALQDVSDDPIAKQKHEESRSKRREDISLLLCAMGYCALDRGNELDALRFGQTALAIDPDLSVIYRLLALISWKSLIPDQQQKTSSYFEKAIKLMKYENPYILRQYSTYQALQCNYQDALLYMERSLRARPHCSLSWRAFGVMTYLFRGLPQDAILFLKKARELNPMDIECFRLEGQMSCELGDHENGKKCFLEALRIFPKEPLLLANLAIAMSVQGYGIKQMLSESGKLQDVISIYKERVQSKSIQDILLSEDPMEIFEAALRSHQEILTDEKFYADSSELYFLYGMFFLKQTQIDSLHFAKLMFQHSLSFTDRPTHPLSLYMMGWLSECEGDLSVAEKYYCVAVQIDPIDPLVFLRLNQVARDTFNYLQDQLVEAEKVEMKIRKQLHKTQKSRRLSKAVASSPLDMMYYGLGQTSHSRSTPEMMQEKNISSLASLRLRLRLHDRVGKLCQLRQSKLGHHLQHLYCPRKFVVIDPFWLDRLMYAFSVCEDWSHLLKSSASYRSNLGST